MIAQDQVQPQGMPLVWPGNEAGGILLIMPVPFKGLALCCEPGSPLTLRDKRELSGTLYYTPRMKNFYSNL